MPLPVILLDIPLPEFVRELLDPHVEIWPWAVLETATAEELGRVEGLYTYAHEVVDGPLMDRLTGLKVISNYGAGVDHIDVSAAVERKLPVGYTPGAVESVTADMTLALLLAVARNLIRGDRFARGPDFSFYDPSHLLGHDVFESTLGIIGLGRIGKQVARRARGFDMRILYHNRRRDLDAESELGVEYKSLEALLETAQFITLNLPLTEETRGMIGEAEFRRMRSDAYLINVARGAVVDHDALLRALRENWIAGAALDVTEPEPLPRDHPLLELENLVIMPHLGSATVGARLRMGKLANANLLAGLRGEALEYRVTV